ncbi:MAG TPA: TlpA disulfide reductase family protein [Ferruginibacter sp.]|jgi:thiol-disulfide isomerase/thioredoxin|nr:TlpA disulfide reductase family protein [Ferruginibacter sp.]HPH91218.1 TlpA disulfide reductase family protein [Ferruginibacter sp.]
MKNKLLPLFAIAIVFFISCSNTSDKNAGEIEEQKALPASSESKPTLPAFKIRTADGSTINMEELKGKKVFLNLWATWCPPCKAELPSIEKLYQKVDKANTVFLMLSLDENFETAKKFAAAGKINLPVYAPGETLPEMFNTGSIPATFIFNEEGEMIKMISGMDDYDTDEYVQLLTSKK